MDSDIEYEGNDVAKVVHDDDDDDDEDDDIDFLYEN
jgi:hypothetical protein